MPRAVINRPCYSMALPDENESAEITMYGEIVQARPTDWWGDPIDGDFIIQSEFLEDLKRVENAKKITIRMNSLGGDCVVSLLIHNRLREMVEKGVEITCLVDGVAMSGGSLIMCACDNVQVNPSSLVMIHKCWSFLYGGYNADDLRSMATENDAYDKAQVAVYARKTGLSETSLMHMMSNTTYMTGEEALEKGFADAIVNGGEPLEIAASASGHELYVRGRKIHMPKGFQPPEWVKKITPEENSPAVNKPENSGIKTGGTETMPTTLEELRAQNPELADALLAEARAEVAAESERNQNAAVQNERTRLSDIDSIAALYDDDTVRDAKYTNPCTAQEMAFRAAQAQVQQGRRFNADLESDAKDSKANEVPSASAEEEDAPMTKEQRMAQGKADAKALSK